MQVEASAGNECAHFPTPGFDAHVWHATSLPTTVLGALVRLGLYPDPYLEPTTTAFPTPAKRTAPGAGPGGSGVTSFRPPQTLAAPCGCTWMESTTAPPYGSTSAT
jgi:hypothetical protein